MASARLSTAYRSRATTSKCSQRWMFCASSRIVRRSIILATGSFPHQFGRSFSRKESELHKPVSLRNGKSTRPSEMADKPEADPPIVRGETAAKDIGTAVDFILQRRNIPRLNLLGWSWAQLSWRLTQPKMPKKWSDLCCTHRFGFGRQPCVYRKLKLG